jgi:hypothetical protein
MIYLPHFDELGEGFARALGLAVLKVRKVNVAPNVLSHVCGKAPCTGSDTMLAHIQ